MEHINFITKEHDFEKSYEVTFTPPASSHLYNHPGLGYYEKSIQHFDFQFVRNVRKQELFLKVTYRSSTRSSSIVWQTDEWVDTYEPGAELNFKELTLHLYKGNTSDTIPLQTIDFKEHETDEEYVENATLQLDRERLAEICEADNVIFCLKGSYKTLKIQDGGGSFIKMARIFYNLTCDTSKYLSTINQAINEVKQKAEMDEKIWKINSRGCAVESILILLVIILLCFKAKAIISVLVLVALVFVAIARRKMADQYYYEE